MWGERDGSSVAEMGSAPEMECCKACAVAITLLWLQMTREQVHLRHGQEDGKCILHVTGYAPGRRVGPRRLLPRDRLQSMIGNLRCVNDGDVNAVSVNRLAPLT
jgi:hypothetical protein